MARAQKKKTGSPKKKKTSAKVASQKGEKSMEDTIINLSQTGSPLRKFSKNLLEYRPSQQNGINLQKRAGYEATKFVFQESPFLLQHQQ